MHTKLLSVFTKKKNVHFMFIPLGLVKFRLESQSSMGLLVQFAWASIGAFQKAMEERGWLATAWSLQDLEDLCKQQVHTDLSLI